MQIEINNKKIYQVKRNTYKQYFKITCLSITYFKYFGLMIFVNYKHKEVSNI